MISRGQPKLLLAVLAGYALMQMGNTLQGTLLSVRGGLEGFSPAQIGTVGAGFWVGVVIGSLRGGRIIARVGHIRTFAGLAAIASSAALLHLLVIDPYVWMVARALTGFCFAGLFMVVESWLNGIATPGSRGRIMSIYGMTGAASIPIISAVADSLGNDIDPNYWIPSEGNAKAALLQLLALARMRPDGVWHGD